MSEKFKKEIKSVINDYFEYLKAKNKLDNNNQNMN